MFEFEINDSDEPTIEEKKTFKIVGEGKCYFIIESAEVGLSKSSGNEQCVYVLKVTDEFGTTNKVWKYVQKKMNKVGLEIFKNFLSACGKINLFEKAKQQGYLNEQELVGCTGACHIKHEYYKDSLQPRIKFFYDKNEGTTPHHTQQAKESTPDGFDDLDGIPF